MSETGTILLVEDDPKLSDLVASFLRKNGLTVMTELRGDAAVSRILELQPDVVVLDIMLPGLDGLSVCREVRDEYRGHILMLTARGEDIDEVLGLEFGADDYMSKPVRPRVLLARIHALIRRGKREPESARRRDIAVGRLLISATNRSVSVGGDPIELSTAEFDLLWYLAERAGQAVERDSLYQDLRGIEWDGLDRSIDLRVSRVRRKLGEDGSLIKSLRGSGYMLVGDP